MPFALVSLLYVSCIAKQVKVNTNLEKVISFNAKFGTIALKLDFFTIDTQSTCFA